MNSAYSKEDLKKEVITLLRQALMIQEHVVRVTYNPKDRNDEYKVKRHIWEALLYSGDTDEEHLLMQSDQDYRRFVRNNYHDLP